MLDIVKALVYYIAVILAVHRANNVRYKVHVHVQCTIIPVIVLGTYSQ